MKPLTNLETFLQRFNNFKDGEFRSIEVISPTTMKITLAGQDEGRAYDWVSVQLEFSGISDARLLEDTKLPLLDMNEGISLFTENSTIYFGLGDCSSSSSVKNASIFLVSSTVKYEEGTF